MPFGKVFPILTKLLKVLLKLRILIIASFCFGKFIKISERATPSQSFLLISNT